MTTIDMQTMRYINLLDKVSRVQTRKCFIHNNTLFFAVDKIKVAKAIGVAASNIRKIQEKIGKRVRIIGEPEGLSDIKRFISDIVSPVRFKSLEIRDNTVIITAGNNQTKASLIGRDKRRYEELRRVVRDFFEFDLNIK